MDPQQQIMVIRSPGCRPSPDPGAERC